MAELRATSVSNLRHCPWGHYRLYLVFLLGPSLLQTIPVLYVLDLLSLL